MRRMSFHLLPAAVMAFSPVAVALADQGTDAVQAKLGKQLEASAALSPQVKAFAVVNLLPTTTSGVWVKAVEAQNAKRVPLSEIQATDAQWSIGQARSALQTELTSNACAQEASKLTRLFPAVVEVFVMDDQGALVCANMLTSDYWQGDEDKWKNAFNGGTGGVDVGAVQLDQSAQTNLQQVSLPVIGAGGKVIGAVTFGLAAGRI